jgi:hypothetical protein
MAITKHQPIQLSDQLSLYSGDVITLNNSSPLLVEVLDNEKIKLRKLDKSEYLYKSKGLFTKAINPLRFSSDTKKFSVFFITKEINNNKVSLQTNDKYLDFDSNFRDIIKKALYRSIRGKAKLTGDGDLIALYPYLESEDNQNGMAGVIK